jgi:hypothetical protein
MRTQPKINGTRITNLFPARNAGPENNNECNSPRSAPSKETKLVAAREADGPFRSAEDLTRRVPSLSRQELARLAGVGALNSLAGVEHRRDAIW